MALTYKDLTDQDAILLLKYEIGAFALNQSCKDHYETYTSFPRPIPDPTDLLMSHLLQRDFRAEIYDKFGASAKVPGSFWCVGDELRGIVWDKAIELSRQEIIKVDQELLNELRGDVQRMWSDFKKHNNLEEFAEPTTVHCQYVPSGVIVNGEMLYKRVGVSE